MATDEESASDTGAESIVEGLERICAVGSSSCRSWMALRQRDRFDRPNLSNRRAKRSMRSVESIGLNPSTKTSAQHALVTLRHAHACDFLPVTGFNMSPSKTGKHLCVRQRVLSSNCLRQSQHRWSTVLRSLMGGMLYAGRTLRLSPSRKISSFLMLRPRVVR